MYCYHICTHFGAPQRGSGVPPELPREQGRQGLPANVRALARYAGLHALRGRAGGELPHVRAVLPAQSRGVHVAESVRAVAVLLKKADTENLLAFGC